jgi:hypothetical protein
VLRVAARAVVARVNADHTDHVGPALPCPQCHQPAAYAGRHEKTFESVLGPLPLTRAYYYCAPCQAGFCPRDHALGLAGASVTPAVTRMTGLVGAMVSFGEGHELLHALAGVDVDAKQVERIAEGLGRAIAADEHAVVEPTPPTAPTMYLGLDGTGIPMRASALAGRPGKQPDGTAKTREVKLCTVWTADGRDAQGLPVRDPGSVSYSAAIESAAARDTASTPAAFAQRVDREARRRGFDAAARQVVLGDGALWIWNLAEEQFPGAVQIVDLYHAKAHLSDIAKAVYGPASDVGAHWAQQRHTELDAGRLAAIVNALRRHAATSAEAAKGIGYIVRNRRRLRYPAFRAQGLCVSTGVVEAGCKTAIGKRLKQSGMHWSVAGADAIIALRCCKLSGRFEDFWERRSVSRHAVEMAARASQI